VFVHIGYGLLAQFGALPQAMRTALKLWGAALQQYSAKHTHALHIAFGLVSANIEYQVDLAYFITPLGCPATQTLIKSGFIQVKHAFPLIYLAYVYARISLLCAV